MERLALLQEILQALRQLVAVRADGDRGHRGPVDAPPPFVKCGSRPAVEAVEAWHPMGLWARGGFGYWGGNLRL
eukprot:4937841-Prymnesium_polylepis.1